ncbi:hypothetical protein PQR62_00230 [Herbaspirillum lusitanum]|uniref:Uncharacterized protein n=1 Tax=Herbaspirillum lusitanum TaxID=213312 RepID=A0ABW9A1E2_9BURK
MKLLWRAHSQLKATWFRYAAGWVVLAVALSGMKRLPRGRKSCADISKIGTSRQNRWDGIHIMGGMAAISAVSVQVQLA